MSTPDEISLALLTPDEMARADKAAIAAGTTGLVLMERAGRAVADAVSRRARPGQAILVLCGPGNNGGDGFVAARLLRERGFAVTLALSVDRAAMKGDARAMARAWTGEVMPISSTAPERAAVVVDALFGAGLDRPLIGEVAALAHRVNASEASVIAVDVPSGLSGETGRADGPVIEADETVTFFRLKPGHLLHPGRGLCGVVTLADIGITAEAAFGDGALEARTFCNAPPLWRSEWPNHAVDTHKYKRGAVLVLAGGLAGVGAPRLGARAALRIGAGLVTIACRPEALAAHAARGPDALIQRGVGSAADIENLLAEKRLGAVLAGPALGLDATAREAVLAALRSNVPAVFDADALTLLAAETTSVSIGTWTKRRGAACVLTPHEGEFERLFASSADVMTAPSKLERARRASAATGAVVVLKGPDSIIAEPDGRAAINMTGSPALATAGSGDVLAGLIAGLLAQGMPAFQAACAAVWLHGKAAERLGRGLIADDLPEAILPALSELPAQQGG
ncbi:bifunctional ADP-dependent NAD(P)H-hydrate dehydratase/NAD(P)H-hydrate epimerase [Bosea sp. LC85]|uniref:bifunctional ADP-dependent NAD(P)H-hydrate dehydratase/NAD(P)H-hydrate epimerase n=1 Tax=Bosea sp. LC85 TaxID=1502851 RepID=UPI0005B91369|nr:bifunctional ADP-dependent NAD(P)H-hydrate dehydratase/NAD(P)H-hydrate epimerase [Bosea sp. LC85]